MGRVGLGDRPIACRTSDPGSGAAEESRNGEQAGGFRGNPHPRAVVVASLLLHFTLT
nr:hypothetical protein [Oxynema sp. CENA135]